MMSIYWVCLLPNHASGLRVLVKMNVKCEINKFAFVLICEYVWNSSNGVHVIIWILCEEFIFVGYR